MNRLKKHIFYVLICGAGFFQGLISIDTLHELVRMTKKGGLILWSIAEGYEHYGRDYARFEQTVDKLVKEGVWRFHCPVRRYQKLVFTDCGAAFLSGYKSAGIATDGFIYIMQRTSS